MLIFLPNFPFLYDKTETPFAYFIKNHHFYFRLVFFIYIFLEYYIIQKTVFLDVLKNKKIGQVQTKDIVFQGRRVFEDCFEKNTGKKDCKYAMAS